MAQLAVRSLSTLVRIQPSANFYKRLFVLLSTVGTEIMKRKEARMFFKNIENVQNSFFFIFHNKSAKLFCRSVCLASHVTKEIKLDMAQLTPWSPPIPKRRPRYEFSLQQNLLNNYLLLNVCRKEDENKETVALNGPFFKKSGPTPASFLFILVLFKHNITEKL